MNELIKFFKNGSSAVNNAEFTAAMFICQTLFHYKETRTDCYLGRPQPSMYNICKTLKGVMLPLSHWTEVVHN